MTGSPSDEGYYIEFKTMGRTVKVSAIDPESGTEVSIVGDAAATQKELSDLAIKKLLYILDRKASGER